MKRWNRFGRQPRQSDFPGNGTQMSHGQLERLQILFPFWNKIKTMTCHDESR